MPDAVVPECPQGREHELPPRVEVCWAKAEEPMYPAEANDLAERHNSTFLMERSKLSI